MRQQKLQISCLLLATLLATSCSNENETESPIDKSDVVELGITAGVSLTKSAITGGDNNQSGADADVMQAIAVYASSTGYTKENYGLYSQSGGTWTNNATDKIYLTSETATIYAYHPAYQPDGTTYAMATTGTALTLALSGSAVAADATIPVSIFKGGDSSDGGLNTNSTITVPTSATTKVLSAPGEVDYMWAEKMGNTDKFKASNGKGSDGSTYSVDLNMKHALTMVSFRIYNDGHYNKAGKLTKIVLENKNGKVLNDGGLGSSDGKPVMKIATGAITIPTEDSKLAAATYTRLIAAAGGSDGYVLPKQGEVGYTGNDAAKNAAAIFGILVLPDASTVAKNNIKVTFTIDGDSFDVDLAADNTGVQWEPGKNNLYTAKLSGKDLTLTTVKVEAWGTGADKDLGVE